MGFKKPFGKPAGRPVGRNSRAPSRGGFDSKFSRDGPSGFVKRDSYSKPRGSFGDRPNKLELFDVTCESCGKDTQVPFKPTGDRPVYCRDCFKGGDSERPTRKGNERSAPSGDLAEINRKLDLIMAALKIR